MEKKTFQKNKALINILILDQWIKIETLIHLQRNSKESLNKNVIKINQKTLVIMKTMSQILILIKIISLKNKMIILNCLKMINSRLKNNKNKI